MLPPTNVRDAPATGQGSAARSWRNVGIFLVTLAALHVPLEAWLPLPDLGKVSEKFAYFARHKDEFDAVFIGSSRVYRQIVPQLFDAQVSSATGQPMNSFNLGAPSMFLPESLFTIDRVVALRPARLRWMFIELDDPRPRLEEHAGLVQREVYWHGWRETALTCTGILTARSVRIVDRVLMLAHQAALFGRCWTHVGGVLDLLEQWQSPPARITAADRAALGVASDGYEPYRGTLGQGKSPGKDPVADLKNYLTAAAALKGGTARSEGPAKAAFPLRWVLSEKTRALRARGIEPVFIIPPVTTAEEEFLTLSKQGVLRSFLAFNDPNTYPDLYQANLRADTVHLNETGALLFTRLLAGKFSEYAVNARRTADGAR